MPCSSRTQSAFIDVEDTSGRRASREVPNDRRHVRIGSAVARQSNSYRAQVDDRNLEPPRGEPAQQAMVGGDEGRVLPLRQGEVDAVVDRVPEAPRDPHRARRSPWPCSFARDDHRDLRVATAAPTAVKHDMLRRMKTISVRDLRQRWPEAEARLQVEKEIVITRDAKPVAKLVRIDDRPKPRKRFDPAAHARWQRRIAGGKVSRWVDRAVREAREDRR